MFSAYSAIRKAVFFSSDYSSSAPHFCLSKALASVHIIVLSGDIAPLITAQQPHDISAVLFLPVEADRDQADHFLCIHLVRERFFVSVGVDDAGRHAVDGDSIRCQLRGKRLDHRDCAALLAA